MGESFAFMQIKTVLSVLFEMYELEPVGETFALPNYDGIGEYLSKTFAVVASRLTISMFPIVVGPHGNTRVRYCRREKKSKRATKVNAGRAAVMEESALTSDSAIATHSTTSTASMNISLDSAKASINVMEISTDKVFSREEIRKHRTATDCWIIVGDLVYDITNFVRLHQGGEGQVDRSRCTRDNYTFRLTGRCAALHAQCAAPPCWKGRKRSRLRSPASSKGDDRSAAVSDALYEASANLRDTPNETHMKHKSERYVIGRVEAQRG